MSLAYRILYAVGFTPWEQLAETPAASQIASLLDREERERGGASGSLLDLGCGSGIWAVEFARRGWEVTGVDFVPKALRRARERAREAGVDPRLVQGDVTKLEEAGINSGFDLLVDFNCFHDELTDEERAAEGRGATAVAALGATLLMLAMKPARRGPLPRGASAEDIQTAFPGWELVDEIPADVEGAPGWVVRGEPRFYRLRYPGAP